VDAVVCPRVPGGVSSPSVSPGSQAPT